MQKRWRLWLSLLTLLVVAGVALHPAVYWRLVGWAKGGAFYQGRPTSYWRRQLQALDRVALLHDGYVLVDRKPRWVPEATRPLWGAPQTGDFTALPAVLADQDQAAVPVLLALAQDEDEFVRWLATAYLLGIDPEAARRAGVD